jgi:hypothetical protein
MGAYTTVTSSEFNGFPKPHVIYSSTEVMPYVVNWPESLSESLTWQNNIEYALETRSKI